MSIARMIMAGSEEESRMWSDIETCKMYASRQMFCPVSGVILDTRTVVVIELTHMGKTQSTCMHGDTWDTREKDLRAACAEKGVDVNVIDGRVLERARKDLTNAKARKRRIEKARKQAEQSEPRP
jgi:hypothetical protein